MPSGQQGGECEILVWDLYSVSNISFFPRKFNIPRKTGISRFILLSPENTEGVKRFWHWFWDLSPLNSISRVTFRFQREKKRGAPAKKQGFPSYTQVCSVYTTLGRSQNRATSLHAGPRTNPESITRVNSVPREIQGEVCEISVWDLGPVDGEREEIEFSDGWRGERLQSRL